MPNELTPEMIAEFIETYTWVCDQYGGTEAVPADVAKRMGRGLIALLAAARSNAQVREGEEELAHLQDCLGMAQTGPDACVTVRASALGHVLRSADPDYARGVEIAKRSAGAFREALERSAALKSSGEGDG